MLRSPTAGGKEEARDSGDFEGSQNTPREMSDRGKRYLAWRAMEMSSLARYGKQLPGGSEMKERTVEEFDYPYSDSEKEEKYYLTGFEIRSLTKPLIRSRQERK